LLRDEIKKGDGVLFYHSNIKMPCIVGIAEVVNEGYPDYTAWDLKSEHYDPKSSVEKPIWYMVDIQYAADLDPPVTRENIKAHPVLEKMGVMKKGNRLSVMPVAENEWQAILKINGMADPLK
jgi:predicted RNA-binding protein with PUA-like domain